MQRRAHMRNWRNRGRPHHLSVAFADGLKLHGWALTDDFHAADLVIQYAVDEDYVTQPALAEGCEYLTIETPYLSPKSDYHSIGFGNAINGRLRHDFPRDPDRRERLFRNLLKPWREPQEGPCMIMGQMPKDRSIAPFIDMYAWIEVTWRALEAKGESVLFRPHPQFQYLRRKKSAEQKNYVSDGAREEWAGVAPLVAAGLRVDYASTLPQLMDRVKCAVTFNSSSAIDCVLAGLPTIALDRGSMAWDATTHNIDSLAYPDREEWLNWLAYCQWTEREMRSGDCWASICPAKWRKQ